MAKLKRTIGHIAYDVHGEGEPLVILRGLGRSVKHWLGYEKTLAKHFRVITMDLRGIGETTFPCGFTTSIFDLADDVVAVLDDLGLKKAHLLGVSLGGMVTLAAGMTHADRFASLIVVNTSIAGNMTLRLSVGAVRAILSGAVDRGSIHRRLVDVLVGSACPPETRASIVNEYTAIAKTSGMYELTVLKQLLGAARFNVKGRLKDLRVPTMVVYGTDDRFVPHINSRKIARYIPDSKLVPIEGGGHELTLDKGPELAAVVKEWIAERPCSA